MTAMTRGPLPARVYWRRRLVLALVLVGVIGLVVGSVRLLAGGAEVADRPARATQVAAEPTETAAPESEPEVVAPDTPSEERSQRPEQGRKKQEKSARKPALAEPEGVCSDRDIAVTPAVDEPVGGDPITFTLELRTISTPACTWKASPATLTMKITSGPDDIWSSTDCPRAIPTEDLVVRQDVGTEVEVTWSGRRSDDDCSTRTEWAMPGWYYVDAAALAGEPSDLHFELTAPQRAVREEVARPDRERRQARQERREQREAGQDRRDRQDRRDQRQGGTDRERDGRQDG